MDNNFPIWNMSKSFRAIYFLASLVNIHNSTFFSHDSSIIFKIHKILYTFDPRLLIGWMRTPARTLAPRASMTSRHRSLYMWNPHGQIACVVSFLHGCGLSAQMHDSVHVDGQGSMWTRWDPSGCWDFLILILIFFETFRLVFECLHLMQ
jgi:hypothetical protein